MEKNFISITVKKETDEYTFEIKGGEVLSLKVCKLLGSLVYWEGSFKFEGMINMSAKWAIFDNVNEIFSFIAKSLKSQKATWHIDDNKELCLIFTLKLEERDANIPLRLPPKELTKDMIIANYEKTIKELKEKLEDKKDNVPNKEFHRIVTLKSGSFSTTSQSYIDFTGAKGELAMLHDGALRWDLFIDGIYQSSGVYKILFRFMVKNKETNNTIYLPDSNGIPKTTTSSMSNAQAISHSDYCYLPKGNYEFQLQINSVSGASFNWNYSYGNVYLNAETTYMELPPGALPSNEKKYIWAINNSPMLTTDSNTWRRYVVNVPLPSSFRMRVKIAQLPNGSFTANNGIIGIKKFELGDAVINDGNLTLTNSGFGYSFTSRQLYSFKNGSYSNDNSSYGKNCKISDILTIQVDKSGQMSYEVNNVPLGIAYTIGIFQYQLFAYTYASGIGLEVIDVKEL